MPGTNFAVRGALALLIAAGTSCAPAAQVHRCAGVAVVLVPVLSRIDDSLTEDELARLASVPGTLVLTRDYMYLVRSARNSHDPEAPILNWCWYRASVFGSVCRGQWYEATFESGITRRSYRITRRPESNDWIVTVRGGVHRGEAYRYRECRGVSCDRTPPELVVGQYPECPY